MAGAGLSELIEHAGSSKSLLSAEGGWARLRRIGDVRQWLGTNGGEFGTSGNGRTVFLTTFAITAVIVGVVNINNVMTFVHEEPRLGLGQPIVWELSSWITWLGFLWIPWLAYRLAPPLGAPWWRLAAVHPVCAVLFAVGHIGGFVVLRKLAYALSGANYAYGPFWHEFLYEFGKDAMGYVLTIAGFTLNERVFGALSARPKAKPEATYTIRDGNRLIRVAIADVLAVSSAGNYVEFVLRDGRKPLMRSPLGAIALELEPHGFLRVHRSWLVNPQAMTALTPDGSGDYTVALGSVSVPLSRRFPDALAKLKAA
jgi:hypothetical protein